MNRSKAVFGVLAALALFYVVVVSLVFIINKPVKVNQEEARVISYGIGFSHGFTWCMDHPNCSVKDFESALDESMKNFKAKHNY